MNDILSMYMPSEVKTKMAERAKKLRLQKGYKRTTLAERSGVPAPSIKRFETTGNISLSSLLKIANALGCIDDFLKLFSVIEPMKLSDLEQQEKGYRPKRGKI